MIASRKVEVDNRNELRGNLEDSIRYYIKAGDKINAKRALDLLRNDKLVRAYDEQSYNKPYISALRKNFKKETGDAWTGNDSDLVEQDFEYWNTTMNSLVTARPSKDGGGLDMAGALPTLYKSASEMSEKDRADMLLRFNAFNDTSSIGTGSRPGIEQFKQIASDILADPVTYASLGIGKLFAIGTRPATAYGIKQLFKPGMAFAAASALESGSLDLSVQSMESNLGGRDVSPLQTVASTTIGGVAPWATKGLGKNVIGPTFRAITHPKQSLGELASRGMKKTAPQAAAQGVITDAKNAVTKAGVNLPGGMADFQKTSKQILDDAGKYWKSEYLSYPLEDVNWKKVNKALAPWRKWSTPVSKNVPDGRLHPMKFESAIDIALESLESGFDAAGKAYTPAMALRTIKKAVSNAVKSGFKGGEKYSNADAELLEPILKQIRKIEDVAAKAYDLKKWGGNIPDGAGYLSLKKNYRQWASIRDSDFGKKFIAASDPANPDKAGKLIKSMLRGDFNWSQVNQFDNLVNNLEKTMGKAGHYKGSLMQNFQRAAGYFLLEKNELSKLLATKEGLRILKKLYPKQIAFWDDIVKLNKIIPDTQGGQMVSSNLATARIIGNLGTGVSGSKAGGDVALATVMNFVNRLADKPWFQHAMINAYKRRGGRLHTAVHKKLYKELGEGRNLKDPDIVKEITKQISDIQDYMWSLGSAKTAKLFASYAYRNNPDVNWRSKESKKPIKY